MTRKDYQIIAMGVVQIWFEMRLPRIEISKIVKAMGTALYHRTSNFNMGEFNDYINKQIEAIIKQEEPF